MDDLLNVFNELYPLLKIHKKTCKLCNVWYCLIFVINTASELNALNTHNKSLQRASLKVHVEGHFYMNFEVKSIIKHRIILLQRIQHQLQILHLYQS